MNIKLIFTLRQTLIIYILSIDDNTGPSQCEEVRVFLKDLPSFQRLQVRENFTLTCQVIGNKVAEQFTWFKDGYVSFN